MDARYRNLLERYRVFLERNVVLTPEFCRLLEEEKILTPSMVKDAQGGGSMEERNRRMLDALKLRPNTAFRKFRALLLRTGHSFLADVLLEEAGDMSVDESILSPFPIVVQGLSEDTKQKFLVYLDSKIKERALLSTWFASPRERRDRLDTHAADIRFERKLQDTVEEQEKKIRNLTTEMGEREDSVRRLSLDLRALQMENDRLKATHKEKLEVQARFNSANNSTIVRMRDQFNALSQSLFKINDLLRSFLGDEASPPDLDLESTRLASIERNVRLVVQKARDSQELACSASSQQRDVSQLLGFGDSNLPLLEVVRQYTEKRNKAYVTLAKELGRLGSALGLRSHQNGDVLLIGSPRNDATTTNGKTTTATKGSKGQPKTSPRMTQTTEDNLRAITMQVATLRAEADHAQKRDAWRDSELTRLRQEVDTLHARLQESSYAAVVTPYRKPKRPLTPAARLAPSGDSSGASDELENGSDVNSGSFHESRDLLPEVMTENTSPRQNQSREPQYRAMGFSSIRKVSFSEK